MVPTFYSISTSKTTIRDDVSTDLTTNPVLLWQAQAKSTQLPPSQQRAQSTTQPVQAEEMTRLKIGGRK